ncbi:MAG: ABC transporter ATP-binding protein [Chloroflexota bacterium]|nr:ABC transporter ATP-binding protein [Chloroflexota bacterium]
MAGRLVLEGIEKSFGSGAERLRVLDRTSLVVEQSQFLCLVGPSGCGKSTLFNVAVGLTAPDSGRILLDGSDITGRRGLLGYMPQRDLLLPWRRVMENIVIGVQVRRGDLAAARRRAPPPAPRFGLEGFLNHHPHQLSGGMRQRAALLRTIVSGNQVLLLDEPFGALDALTRLDMHRFLLGVRAELDLTVLFVTHDPDEAVALADKVAVMSARPGRIVDQFAVELAFPRRGDRAAAALAGYRARLLAALGSGLSSESN